MTDLKTYRVKRDFRHDEKLYTPGDGDSVIELSESDARPLIRLGKLFTDPIDKAPVPETRPSAVKKK